MGKCPLGFDVAPKATFTTGVADTMAALKDLPTTGAPWRYAGDGVVAFGEHLLNISGVAHVERRKLLQPFFTGRAVQSYRPMVEATIAQVLDELDAKQTAELVAEFAVRIPLLVMGQLMGIPQPQLNRLQVLVNRVTANQAPSEETLDELSALAGHVLRRTDPAATTISGAIVRAMRGKQPLLGVRSAIGLFLFVFGAGVETTSIMLSGSILHLLEHPKVANQPVDAMLNELLAVVSPLQWAAPRTDVDGNVVFPNLAAANREALSKGEKQIAFGYGPHRCLGAQLAWLEAELALPGLLARFPQLKLDGEVTYRESFHLPGAATIPVAY